MLAADCKCRISIALGDCFTLATAKLYAAKPVFLKLEKELRRNLDAICSRLGYNLVFILEWISVDLDMGAPGGSLNQHCVS